MAFIIRGNHKDHPGRLGVSDWKGKEKKEKRKPRGKGKQNVSMR